jgi:2'-5' RNA ligase
MPAETIRTFIALEIDDQAKNNIIEIQDKIKKTESLKGSWVKKDNLHLTLKFLGDTKTKHIEIIKNNISKCFNEVVAINCNLVNIGTFPNDKSPRVLWVGMESGESEIVRLADKLEEALFKIGFKKEKRDFKTHITICRPRQILNHQIFKSTLEEINKEFKPQDYSINKITFFESELIPEGPIYSPLLSIFLK